MRWLDGIIHLMGMDLVGLWVLVMDRVTWHAAVHGVTKGQTWLNDWTELKWIDSLLACRVSDEKSAVYWLEFPIYYMTFSQCFFQYFILFFNFSQFDYYVSWLFLLGFILPGSLCFSELVDYFLSHFREAFSYCLLNFFLRFFLSLFSLWDPYKCKFGTFKCVLDVF